MLAETRVTSFITIVREISLDLDHDWPIDGVGHELSGHVTSYLVTIQEVCADEDIQEHWEVPDHLMFPEDKPSNHICL